MNLTLKKSEVILGGADLHDDDPRFGNIVKPWDGKTKMDIGIVGVPFDGGVLASGGRVGAQLAPDAIREQLKKYGTATNIEHDVDLRSLSIFDCGNVVVSKNIVTTHTRTTRAMREVFRFADTVIVFGGGHDISYATILSLYDFGKIGGMNIDAHFDVRPIQNGIITSGTPFWRLLKSGIFSGENFFEVASQGHTNAKAHYEYLLAKKANVIFLHDILAEIDMEEFDKATKDCDALFVSVDMDAIAQAFAPGVSAPSPDGLFPADILRFAYLTGQNPRVRLFEIMEMNPLYDIDGRTARLASNIVLEFCAGRATTRRK